MEKLDPVKLQRTVLKEFQEKEIIAVEKEISEKILQVLDLKMLNFRIHQRLKGIRMSRQLTYREALNEAMAQEMRRDDNVFTYGIDVADHKQFLKVPKDLLKSLGLIVVSVHL